MLRDTRNPRNPNIWWIAGAPELSFTQSFGAVSTLLLAATNTSLIPIVTDLLKPETQPLQILGFVFAIPIVVAPMLLRVGLRPVEKDEVLISPQVSSDESGVKMWVIVYLLASAILLFGILMQVFILHSWLEKLNSSTTSVLPPGIDWTRLIPWTIGIIVAVYSIMSIRYAVRTLVLVTDTSPTEPEPIVVCCCCDKKKPCCDKKSPETAVDVSSSDATSTEPQKGRDEAQEKTTRQRHRPSSGKKLRTPLF